MFTNKGTRILLTFIIPSKESPSSSPEGSIVSPTTPTIVPGPPTVPPTAPTPAPVAPIVAPITPTVAPVSPTNAPIAPTAAPVSPTNAPIAPTQFPTQTPSNSPTNQQVCDGLTIQQRTDELESIILSISQINVLTPGSPQDEAFQWLVNDDEVQVCPDDILDVEQRYIMALLYFETNGDSWFSCAAASATNTSPCPSESARFLSGVDVCLWLNVTCFRSEITGISIGKSKGYFAVEPV